MAAFGLFLRQARRCGVMPRPISIAMVLSVAIHMMLFLIVDRLLSDNAQLSTDDAALLISIAPPQADGDVADEKLVVSASGGVSSNQDIKRQASRESDQLSEPVETTEMVIADEIRPNDLSAGNARSDDLQDPIDELASAANVAMAAVAEDTIVTSTDVAATLPSDQPDVIVEPSKSERPDPVRATLSPKQQRMLNRKVRAWSENLHRMPDMASGLTWKHRGQDYLATFTHLPGADEMGIQRVIVEISTEEDGRRMSTEVYLKRLAFSNYAQFVNRWDPDVQIHDDELDGRFHSNTEFSLTYDRDVKPLFHGKVTTSSHRVNVSHTSGFTRRSQIFTGGLQTRVRSIRLPKHFMPFPREAEISDDQVHRFTEDTRITFHANGSFGWHALDPVSSQRVESIDGDTTYLIADEKVKLYVSGTVNGKVLVYSPERIIIEGDLAYEQDPEEVPAADDYLGLVSDKYVDIAPPDVTGPGDLVINAAIYAKRRFAVRGYRFRETALLYLYGSLSVGSLSATEPRYATRIRFDRRLEEMRPPGFPMTDRYEVESWDASWRVEPIG